MRKNKLFSSILFLSFLFIFFGLIYNYSFADTRSCSGGWNYDGTCTVGSSSYTSWVYDSSSNTCTRNEMKQQLDYYTIGWNASGYFATAPESCVSYAGACGKVKPPTTSIPLIGDDGSLTICDYNYSWEVVSSTEVYADCIKTIQTSYRPSITKNSVSTTVYAGDWVYDPVAGNDPDTAGSQTSSIVITGSGFSNKSWNGTTWQYKFNNPGTYTVYYNLADSYQGSSTSVNCSLPAPERSRTFTVNPPITYYTVTYNGNGGTPSSTTEQVASGETANLPSSPTRSGYIFTGWNTASNGSGSSFTTSTVVTGNITVYAQWTVASCQNGPYVWYTSAWSPTTCSSGITQTRTVLCKDGSGSTASDSCCSGTKPSSSYVCPIDPCSGLSNVCIGTTNACSTYAQASCNSTSAPGCTWTSSSVCTGTASACSTYGTSTACTTPAKGCSWSAGSSSCTGTLSYWYSNCSYFKRYQCAWPSDCARNNCTYGGAWCYLNGSSENCDPKAFAPCNQRYNLDFCNAGNGCTWTTNYSCTGTVSACSTYNQTNCPSVTGCSWTTNSSCTGTATACSARTQTQCNLSGSGCTWCPGTNTAPEINPASDQSVCLNTVIADITTATDAEDGSLTSSIVTNSPSGIVKNSQLNYYFTTTGAKGMTYNVTDSGSLAATQKSRTVTVGYCGAWAYGTWGTCTGDPATQTRTVTCMLSGNPVADSYCDPATKPATSQSCDSIPVISPQSTVNTYVYTWIDDTTTATDTEDGNLTSSIDTGTLSNMVKGDTDLRYYFTQDGTYIVTYDVMDSNNNNAVQKTSTVNVGYQAAWDLGDWGNCDENDQRTRTVTCMLSGSPVADGYCEPPKPSETGACVATDFECTSDNIHWNDCNQTFFLASPRSKICTRQIDPIGATSWNWSIPTNLIDNSSPVMRVASTDSATAQDTCLDFDGQFVSPEFQRILRLDIGADGEGGAIEKTINIKLVNPEIQEA